MSLEIPRTKNKVPESEKKKVVKVPQDVLLSEMQEQETAESKWQEERD
jgi:hypothetical protein